MWSVLAPAVQGGDIFNLEGLYGASAEQLERTGAVRRRHRAQGKPTSHCSALIRVLPGNADLYAAVRQGEGREGVRCCWCARDDRSWCAIALAQHTTWSGFENMMRIVVRRGHWHGSPSSAGLSHLHAAHPPPVCRSATTCPSRPRVEACPCRAATRRCPATPPCCSTRGEGGGGGEQ